MSQIKVEEQIGGVILQLKGQFIGGDETDELRSVLKGITEQDKKNLIINMEKVTYLNSTALGILISAHASFAKKGGKVVICNLAKSIENIFVITKLTLVFEIALDLNSAIKIFSNN
ncbi:MAG: STAS domain-containing protein [Candidatus Kapabacteria bacterium]|nr:STAS domain-containing protein [Candidatus Kapabacteria bacterium]